MNIYGETIIEEVLQGSNTVISVGSVAVSDKLTVEGPLSTGAFDVTNLSNATGTFDLPIEKTNIANNTIH